MKTKIEFTSERLDRFGGGWSRRVRVGDAEYSVIMRRGKSVRIPFKRRGQNRGWQWHGEVYQNGRVVWSGRVPGSLGCNGILEEAGIID